MAFQNSSGATKAARGATGSSGAFRFPGGFGSGLSGVFGSDSWLGKILPGSNIDWAKEAKDAWKNSAAGACLWYAADIFPEAPFCVYRKNKDGEKDIVEDHPLTQLLKASQGVMSVGGAAIPGSLLWSATMLSLLVEGNAYWILRRNDARRIVAIQYVPHWCIEPRWDNPADFISHYDYFPDGAVERKDPQDVIHFRQGLDPENIRKGLSRLKMVLKEIVADNEASTYTAAILKNSGVPSVIISPKASAAGGAGVAAAPGQSAVKMKGGFVERVKELWKEITRGDRRGEALVLGDAVDITFPGFSPEQLVLDKIRAMPESRICASMRVPAMVVGLLVGEEHKTYSNWPEGRRATYESMIIPLQELAAHTIDVQLLPQMPSQAGDECGFDRSGVACLQEDVNKLWDRVVKAATAGLITRAAGKLAIGQTVDEKRDDVYLPEVLRVTPDPNEQSADDEAAKARKEWAQKSRERRAAAEAAQ